MDDWSLKLLKVQHHPRMKRTTLTQLLDHPRFPHDPPSLCEDDCSRFSLLDHWESIEDMLKISGNISSIY